MRCITHQLRILFIVTILFIMYVNSTTMTVSPETWGSEDFVIVDVTITLDTSEVSDHIIINLNIRSITKILDNGARTTHISDQVKVTDYTQNGVNIGFTMNVTSRCVAYNGAIRLQLQVSNIANPVRFEDASATVALQDVLPTTSISLAANDEISCMDSIAVSGPVTIMCSAQDYYPAGNAVLTIAANSSYTSDTEGTKDSNTCLFSNIVSHNYTVDPDQNATVICEVHGQECSTELYYQQVTDPDDGTTTPRTEWSTRRASGPSTTPGDDDDCKVGSMKCWEFAVMIIVLGLVTIVVLVLVCVLCKRTKKKQKVDDSESAERNQRQKPNAIEMHNDDEVEEPEGDNEEEEGMRGGAAIVVNENEKDKQKSKTKKDKKTDSQQEKRKKKKQKKDKKGKKGKEPNDEQPQYVNQGSYIHDENADENNVTDDASHDQAVPNVSGKDKPPRILPPIKHTPMQNL